MQSLGGLAGVLRAKTHLTVKEVTAAGDVLLEGPHLDAPVWVRVGQGVEITFDFTVYPDDTTMARYDGTSPVPKLSSRFRFLPS